MKILQLTFFFFTLFLMLLATTGLSLHAPLTPGATTIPVTTFIDEFDDTTTGCSLREAIEAANTDTEFGGCPAGYGADYISLPAGTYHLTRPRSGTANTGNSSGDLNLQTDIALEGIGLAIIDAGGEAGIHDRVLQITGETISLTNLTIRGGRLPDNIPGFVGFYGGGISNNSSSLTLDNVAVEDNHAGDGNSGGSGGGIVSWESSLSIQNSIITNNQSGNGINGGEGGAQGGSGGGIFSSGGTLSIQNSTIANNTAGSGEADKSNGFGGRGGGIYYSGPEAAITASTISGNMAGSSSGSDGGSGGGIYNSGTMILTNSTVSGNTSGSSTYSSGVAGYGGGIYTTTMLVIRHGTITNNHTGDGSYMVIGGGIYNEVAGSLHMGSSILAGNTDSMMDHPDCYSLSTITSEGYNLIGNTNGCHLGDSGINSILDPAGYSLPSLGYFGGLTQTHPLQSGNLAIDWISYGVVGCDDSSPTDQRGYTRPVDGNLDGTTACDIGAYERQMLSFLPLTLK